MPVYFIQAENGLIKIGCVRSATLEKRYRTIGLNSPVPIALLGVIFEDDQDRSYHKQFAHLRHHGEWFNPGPDLISFIEQNAVEVTTEHKVCEAISESTGKPCESRATFGDYCGRHRRDGKTSMRKIDYRSTTILL